MLIVLATSPGISSLFSVGSYCIFSSIFFSNLATDSPVEIAVGTYFLYNLLGVSCFYGLAITCLFMPLNHIAGKVVVGAQDNLMKARDERVALMNEVLGGSRMLKVTFLPTRLFRVVVAH